MISDELILAGKLQLKKLQKKKPEKNSGFDGAWTRASQILVGRSTNWATKPHVGSEANFTLSPCISDAEMRCKGTSIWSQLTNVRIRKNWKGIIHNLLNNSSLFWETSLAPYVDPRDKSMFCFLFFSLLTRHSAFSFGRVSTFLSLHHLV